VNTRTLGRSCTARMGKADSEAPNAEVNGYSRSAQVCYPRGNFSDSSSPHREGHGGSLDPTFVSESTIVQDSVRLPFGLALCGGVLTPLRQPLGPDDSLSSGCRPSQTAHQPLSPNGVSIVTQTVWCSNFASTTPGRAASKAPTYALQFKARYNGRMQ
jgi:hypothetical protein